MGSEMCIRDSSSTGLYVLSSLLCDARCFVFSFDMRFRLGTSPPSRDCGLCHLSISCWFSPFVSSPRHDGSLRKGFDFGFLCLRACVLLQFAFLRLAPPATPTIRGRVLTVVGLAIAPFSSRPPRHTGGTRQVLTDGLPSYSVRVSFNYLLRVFPGFISRPFRGMGVGFEEPHLRFMV